MKRWNCLLLAVLMLLAAVPAGMTAQAENGKMQVVGGWLRLRDAPGYYGTVLASYRTGTIVTVLGRNGDWTRVSVPNGQTGYMLSRYLAKVSGGSSLKTLVVTSPNGRSVNLRSGPGKAYGVIGSYKVGAVAEVLSEGTYWDYIRIGGRTGYMMREYLTGGSPSDPDTPPGGTGYLATVISGNGYGVRLRSGAGKGYSVLGVYSVGTQVIVLKHGSTWDYVQIGTRCGYMMNEFLTTGTLVTVVSAVQLNVTAPTAGTVLKATVTPKNATVTYAWRDSAGNLLGTDATYTVTDADNGRRIRVTVKGTGAYSGTVSSALTAAVGAAAEKKLAELKLSANEVKVGDTLKAVLSPIGASADFFWFRDNGQLVGTAASYKVTVSDIGFGLACKAIGKGAWEGEVSTAYTEKVTDGSPADAQLTGTITIPSVKAGGTITAEISLNSESVTLTWELNGKNAGSGKSITVADDAAGKTLRLLAIAVDGSGYIGSVSSNIVTVDVADAAEKSTEPEKPSEPEKPAEPEKPIEPETPTEPEKHTEPENSTEADKSNEPEMPAD